MTGNLKITDFKSSLMNGIYFIMKQSKQGIVLLGNSCWFVLTLIPNLLTSTFAIIKTIILKLSIAVYEMLTNSCKRLSKATEQIVVFVLDVPLKSAIGLIFLYILFKLRRVIGRFMLVVLRKIYSFIRIIIQRSSQFLTPTRRKIRIPSPESVTRDANQTGENLGPCVICQDNEKSVILMPCRHLCICEICCRELHRNYDMKCPLCRKNIREYITAFI